MDIPFLCSGAALVFLEPGLHGIWAWIAGVVIVAIILSAVAAFWISPVAGAFSLHEKEVRGVTFWVVIAGSVLSCLLLFVGLSLTVFPMGCATHAMLVSAYIPPDLAKTHHWDDEVKRFAQEVKERANDPNNKQMIRDLAPVRDLVLDKLAGSGPVDDTTQIAKLVSVELADFLRHGEGGLDSSAPPRREKPLDPRLVETVELAVLMGWNALYSGPRQGLSYLVSNRAERFVSKYWQTVAETRFPIDINKKTVLTVKPIRAGGKVPQLVRVITANLSEDKTELTVRALVAVHDGGDNIELKLKDDSLTDLVSKTIDVPQNNAAFFVASIHFEGRDLNQAKKLVQPGTNNEVVRNLPSLLPSQPKLYLSGPEGNKLRDTINYLTRQNPVCTNAPDDIKNRLDAWRSSFGFSDFLAPKLVDSIGSSDAVLHMRNDGAILLVPTRAIHKRGTPSPVNLPELEWLGKTPDDPELVGDETHMGDAFVLWDIKTADHSFSLNRLGIPLDGTFKPYYLKNPSPHPTGSLSATIEEKVKISSRRLALDVFATKAGPIAQLFLVPDLDNETQQSYVASVFALDFKKLGVICNNSIPEPERFFAIWHQLFNAILAAANPIVSFSENESLEATGAPSFALTKTDLERLGARRAEFPLLISMGAIAIFLCFVLLGFANARRLQD